MRPELLEEMDIRFLPKARKVALGDLIRAPDPVFKWGEITPINGLINR